MTVKAQSTMKAFLQREVKELLCVFPYLAISLCLIETFRALVLIQQGINQFTHLYFLALVEALALAKVVVLAQDIPIMRALESRRLIWSVLYKSALMTLMVEAANKVEETVFASVTGQHIQPPIHPLILFVTHGIALMSIFIALFMARELAQLLGPGELSRLILGPRESRR